MTTLHEAAQQALELRRLADKFSEGWHDGIKIDATDVMLLAEVAAALEQQQGDEYEVRADGKRVRKDRWQVGIRRIVALLWGNRKEFEIDEVVEAVCALVPQPFDDGDDEALVRAALEQPEQEPVAWRTFDGEGGYDYRTYDDNENYRDEWDRRNPNHKGWVEPLYTHPPRRETEPAAFDALVAISLLTHLGGEVADYEDVVEAVRRLHALNGELLEVAKLALRMGVYGGVSPSTVEDAARAALEQPEQEPYCYVYEYDSAFGMHREFYPGPYNGKLKPDRTVPVYTHPPRREWRSLSEEEIRAALPHEPGDLDFVCARAVEAALRSKNHE